jgi:hypothetical protein
MKFWFFGYGNTLNNPSHFFFRFYIKIAFFAATQAFCFVGAAHFREVLILDESVLENVELLHVLENLVPAKAG